MSGDGLPPLRDVIERFELRARKELGQNFLLDLNLTGKIARTAGDLSQSTVIEVGPGPGGLTRALLSNGARRVVAIERDPRCIGALEEISAHWPGRLEVVPGDALKTDFAALTAGADDVRIVANLPYNIGTQLLLNWIATPAWPPFWTSLTLMFQKEVAQRIVAAPDTDPYGRLGVLAGWRTDARIAFDVPPQAFVPPPKVTSSVIHITPRQAPLPAPLKALERVTEAAFGQRRKMLRRSLAGVVTPEQFAAAGVAPDARPEELGLAAWVALTQATAPD